jgi:cell division FtsZ-interacting protein ZapD
MRKFFEKFMLKFARSESEFAQVFNSSEVKLELIKALKTARLNRQLSAARNDANFENWDRLVLDLEAILRDCSTR